MCDVLERILDRLLTAEPAWSKWDWLDGLVDFEIERQQHQNTVRGAVWVNAGRQEPCGL